jgi:hypothetical protein
MNEQMEALARRAVKCKGWRWMPGMCGPDRAICIEVTTGGRVISWFHDGEVVHDDELPDDDPALPDFDDPATLGCLLALVREAWRCDSIVPVKNSRSGSPGWDCCDLLDQWRDDLHSTEAEALVAALESAP